MRPGGAFSVETMLFHETRLTGKDMYRRYWRAHRGHPAYV